MAYEEDFLQMVGPFLNAIGHVESSGGQNMNHRMVTSGAQAGTRGIGTYALMPRTALALAGQYPEEFPEASGADSPDDMYGILDPKSPKFSELEAKFGTRLAHQLWTQFKGNEPAMSASWLSGPKAGKRMMSGQSLTPEEEDYVRKFQSARRQNAPSAVPARQPLTSGAKRALGHPSYQAAPGAPEPPHGWPAPMPDSRWPIDHSTGLRPPTPTLPPPEAPGFGDVRFSERHQPRRDWSFRPVAQQDPNMGPPMYQPPGMGDVKYAERQPTQPQQPFGDEAMPWPDWKGEGVGEAVAGLERPMEPQLETMPFDFPQRPEYEGLLGTEGRQAAAAQLRALLDDEGPGSTKASRVMDVIGQSLAGLAAGGAASTNYPVWQKAHAITQDAQRDRWMRDKDSALARVQRRDDLMRLMQQDEAARTGQAARDPQMVEVNGQMVPLQVALDQHNARLRSGLERGNIEAGKEADFERMERGKQLDAEKEREKQAAITARAASNREYAMNFAAANARKYGVPFGDLERATQDYFTYGRGYVDMMGVPIPPWTHDKIAEKAALDAAHRMTLANPQPVGQQASARPPAGQDWRTAPAGDGNYRKNFPVPPVTITD